MSDPALAPTGETWLHRHVQRRRDDGIGLDELALAARNHGMPLEAMRADITPAGMHYLLIHYDVPFVDPGAWMLGLDGFQRPLSLTLDQVRRRPAITSPVTLECAGNGRAMFETRPLSQPWLLEAVGTAEWTGTPLAPLLHDAGVPEGTIEIVFEGLDRGVEAGEERPVRTELAPRRGHAPRRAARVRDERAAAASTARRTAPAGRSRLVRHDAREMARADHSRSPSRSRGTSRRWHIACAQRRTNRDHRSAA